MPNIKYSDRRKLKGDRNTIKNLRTYKVDKSIKVVGQTRQELQQINGGRLFKEDIIVNGKKIKASQVGFSIGRSFSHAEGNAAATMRQLDLPEGTIIINNETGLCPECSIALPNILKPGQILEVIFSTDG